ncbi:MAG: SMC-Scp complex subunit ScpB [Halioglobus sp.]
MAETGLVQIVEGALLAAGKAMTVTQIGDLFEEHERPETTAIREALKEVAERCDGRGFELLEVASGFRFQVRQNLSPWIARLWHERPQKYSRALLETLSLIAYRQPITRGEIEEIRGVAVSSNIVKTLHEREWIRVVGHRDVPGRPAMYATTRQFLDYFNLKNLDQLPALAEIRDFETLTAELGFSDVLSEIAEGEAPGLSVVGGTDHNPDQLEGDASVSETGAELSTDDPGEPVEDAPAIEDVAGDGESVGGQFDADAATDDEVLPELSVAAEQSAVEEITETEEPTEGASEPERQA